MHEIYQTEGLVLKSKDLGEADKNLFVFTKDFGLIKIIAQGLRKIASKLRYGLQEFSFAQVSLVRGKNVWRMTNALCDSNFYFSLSGNKKKLIVISRVLNLLNQLVPEEEKNENLYLTIRQALLFLERTELEDKDLPSFENITVLRILYCLGYFDKDKKLNEETFYLYFLDLLEWSDSLLKKMGEEKIKQQVIVDINKSLRSSQLC